MPLPGVPFAAPTDLLHFRLSPQNGAPDLLFNSTPDSNGVEFWVSRLEGWDAPDVRVEESPRPRDHGLYLGDFYYGARQMSLIGALHSPNGLGALRAAREVLVAGCNAMTGYATLHVDETPPKRALVRRGGKVGLKQHGHHYLEFDIPLLAPDPRRYADTLTTVNVTAGTPALATTSGSFVAGTPAVITISPGAGGSVLTETSTGRQVSVTPGGNVLIDGINGTITSGGLLAFNRMRASTDFLTIPVPGNLTFTIDQGSAVITYRDAWV